MEREMVSDVAQVYKLWDQYAAACHNGDLELWMSLWNDEGIQMAPDAPPRVGKEQIRAAMQPTFDQFTISNMVNQEVEVRIMGLEAYSYGIYTFEMTPKEGGETSHFSGKFLDVVTKHPDGSWKIAIDCHNYNEPY